MTAGERIKILREKLGITQEEFSKRLGTTRNTVTNYEANRRMPMDATIKSICREFNINEKWLRTGEGEMFAPEETDAWEEVVKRRGLSSGDRLLIEKFMNLKPAEREVVMKYVLSVTADYSAPAAGKDICAPPAPDASIQEKTEAELEAEADAFAAMAREQFLAEFKKEIPISSARESDVG